MRLLRTFFGLVDSAIGLILADALTGAVSTNLWNAVLAAAVMQAPATAYYAIADRTLHRAAQSKRVSTSCATILLMFGGVLGPLPWIVVAAYVVPGLDVQGISGLLIATACVYAVALVIAVPGLLVWLRRRRSRRAPR